MLENLKMSKKNAPLPSRPEPPAVEKIVQDIQDAPEDDIVFSLLNSENKGNTKWNPLLSLTQQSVVISF